MKSQILAALAVLGALLTYPISAQDEVRRAIQTHAGIVLTDHGPTAFGPDFSATFDRAGMTFAPRTQTESAETLTLRGISVGRAFGSEVALASAPPIADEGRVTYARATGITERFDVSPAGVEQSFLIQDELPGTGDLVVRCAVGGSLAGTGTPSEEGGMRFDTASVGVHLGGVTGIDAAGRRCEGSMRFDDGTLELVLPAPFVDTAEWPVLVDPLVGSHYPIFVDINADDSDFDLAYDATSDLYLAVWHRWGYTGGRYVIGQRFRADGTSVGTWLVISDTDIVISGFPKVANVNFSNRFLVVWRQTNGPLEEIVGRSISAADGSMTGIVPLVQSFDPAIDEYDVGGEAVASSSFQDALLVWRDRSSNPGVRCRAVTVYPNGALDIGTTKTLYAENPPFTFADAPSISRTGGVLGTFLVAYRQRTTILGDWEIQAVAIDRAGDAVTPTLPLTSNSLDEFEPVVDGGSSNVGQFAVAYAREGSVVGEELELKTLRVNGGSLEVTGTDLVSSNLFFLDEYDLAWTPGKISIVWAFKEFFDNDYVIYTRDYDARDATPSPTETVRELEPFVGIVQVAIANAQSGGVAGRGDGVIAYGLEPTTAPNRRDIWGHAYDSLPAGSVTDLGGGCGLGGTLVVNTDPAVGNGYFTMSLLGADSSSAFTILNISSPVAPIDCSPCFWIPFEETSLHTLLFGNTSMIVPIPCDPNLAGATFRAQCTTKTPNASPCSLASNFSVSNYVQVELGP